jgi:hypothetical protein
VSQAAQAQAVHPRGVRVVQEQVSVLCGGRGWVRGGGSEYGGCIGPTRAHSRTRSRPPPPRRRYAGGGNDGVCVDESQASYLPAQTYECKRVKPSLLAVV